MDNLISVIVPVYNSGQYLERCIGSVLDQDHEALEIIIVDDGSTDAKTRLLCDALAADHPQVRTFHKENGGSASASEIVAGALLGFDRKTLRDADLMLLLTFVAFFVFAGNLARVEPVDRLLRELLSGREYLTALLASQIISNVPAALLLSGFTDNGRELLLGVNIGGLGPPIASLASLISLRLYSRSRGARTGRYLLVFTLVNLLLLALLSAARRVL